MPKWLELSDQKFEAKKEKKRLCQEGVKKRTYKTITRISHFTLVCHSPQLTTDKLKSSDRYIISKGVTSNKFARQLSKYLPKIKNAYLEELEMQNLSVQIDQRI